MNCHLFLSTALVAALTAGTATAQTIDLYSGDDSKGLFTSSPAGFKYLDFSPRGVVVDTGESFIVNAADDSDGSMGLFGIVGRNLVGKSVAQFDAATHQLRIEYRFLESNQAPTFKLVLNDRDGADAGEQYKFVVAIDSPSIETTDGYSELFLNITENDADHRNPGKESGFANDGDGIANYDLTQWQLQSVYGSSAPLHVEVRNLAIVAKDDGEPS